MTFITVIAGDLARNMVSEENYRTLSGAHIPGSTVSLLWFLIACPQFSAHAAKISLQTHSIAVDSGWVQKD